MYLLKNMLRPWGYYYDYERKQLQCCVKFDYLRYLVQHTAQTGFLVVLLIRANKVCTPIYQLTFDHTVLCRFKLKDLRSVFSNLTLMPNTLLNSKVVYFLKKENKWTERKFERTYFFVGSTIRNLFLRLVLPSIPCRANWIWKTVIKKLIPISWNETLRWNNLCNYIIL